MSVSSTTIARDVANYSVHCKVIAAFSVLWKYALPTKSALRVPLARIVYANITTARTNSKWLQALFAAIEWNLKLTFYQR